MQCLWQNSAIVLQGRRSCASRRGGCPKCILDDEDEQFGENKTMKLKKIMESADEINTAVIPAAIKIKFEIK